MRSGLALAYHHAMTCARASIVSLSLAALALASACSSGGSDEGTSTFSTTGVTTSGTATATTLPTTSAGETGDSMGTTDSDSMSAGTDSDSMGTDSDSDSDSMSAGTDSDSTDTDTDTEGPKFDLGVQPDVEQMECIDCALTIASMQSGTFAIMGDDVFATATLMGEEVYALGESGSGRFIASADSSLPFAENTDCPLHAWLAGTEGEASVLWFGWSNSDGPAYFQDSVDVEAGIHMPAQYIGNPAQLAADFDIVMYTESSGQFGNDEPSDQEMQTLLDYMQVHGGGLYIVSEFFGYMTQADLDSVNRLLNPLGIESEAVSLNWGNVDGNIEFECFPPPVG